MIERKVLNTFAEHQQLRAGAMEAGGQLFGTVAGSRINVSLATGPRPVDVRTRYSFKPDRRAEQAEIDQFHKKGLLYFGDWHTHPEPVPTPSFQDLKSIREAFTKSTHHLNGFLLVIVGTDNSASGLYVAIHNDQDALPLLSRGSAAETKTFRKTGHS